MTPTRFKNSGGRRKRDAVIGLAISYLPHALAVRHEVVQPLLCIVCYLLRIGVLWAQIGINVEEVDEGLVRFVSFLLWDKVPNVKGSSEGINLLLKRNPVRQF